MSLDHNAYKNQVLFLKGSVDAQIRPEMTDHEVRLHTKDAEVVELQIKSMIKELSYLQSCFIPGKTLNRARLEMMLATINSCNNLYGGIMEATVNALLANVKEVPNEEE